MTRDLTIEPAVTLAIQRNQSAFCEIIRSAQDDPAPKTDATAPTVSCLRKHFDLIGKHGMRKLNR